ncbi:MAG: polymer-forming cytoskeletal protein [Gallionellaceae bacterium]|nr:polymer-forming cytoskeletal protein [Gallionellaceae bacterium]
MFAKKPSPASTGSIDCLIGAKTRIIGDIQFEGGLRVDGQIKGNILGSQHSMLIISEQARLEGEICATQAIIYGMINGTVRIEDHLELQPNARIIGDVQYRTLEMHPGAIVEGRLIHKATVEADTRLLPDIDATTAARDYQQPA